MNCLARNIYHEARGESYKGKLAVAQVVLNRAKHPDFPDSVCGVVYDKGQFSWTKKPSKIRDKEAWQESQRIAQGLLDGSIEGIKGFNAVYFHAKWTTFKFKVKKVTTIGNHVFYTK